jgi:hypothetical protein
MRRFSAVAILVVVRGSSSAQAATWLGGPRFSRNPIVKLIKKFISIVQDGDGDGMSVPKP